MPFEQTLGLKSMIAFEKSLKSIDNLIKNLFNIGDKVHGTVIAVSVAIFSLVGNATRGKRVHSELVWKESLCIVIFMAFLLHVHSIYLYAFFENSLISFE